MSTLFTAAQALFNGGEVDRAAATARQALALEPDDATLHNLAGVVADATYDVEIACRAFGRALAANTRNAMVWANLAGVLARVGIVETAVRAARTALALAPAQVEAHNNRAHALKGAGYIAQALISYRRAMALTRDPGPHSNLLFSLSYDETIGSDALFREYRHWEALHAKPVYLEQRPLATDLDPDRRLIVGYLSQDFREHPLGRILAALFQNHDPALVQLNAYALSASADPVAERCRRHSALWRQVVGWSDAAIAELIRQDRVDILVVVGGHSAGGRLLVAARRPAPVQVSLYDVSTSGLDAIDYWMSDPLLHPKDGSDVAERFTETVLRQPCFFLQPEAPEAPEPGSPPVLRTGRVTFGSFSNPAKLSSATVSMWANALHAVPGSSISLKYVDWYADPAVQARVLQLFQREGVAADRIRFDAGDLGRGAQLGLWNSVDIALDTYPFGGWTTTFEALWMGVPVVSLAGERFAARVGLAVMSRLGLADLVASRPEAFAGIAATLSRDHARLATLRKDLRRRLRQSPLCDGKAQASFFDDAYRTMWRAWCRKHAGGSTRAHPATT